MQFLFGTINTDNEFVKILDLHPHTISGIANKKTSEIKDMISSLIKSPFTIKGGSNFKVNIIREFPYFRKYQDLLKLPNLDDDMNKTDIQVIVFLEDMFPDKIEPFLNKHHIKFTKSYGEFLVRPSFKFYGKDAQIIIEVDITNRNIFVFKICETKLDGMFYPTLTGNKKFTDLNAMLPEIMKHISIDDSINGKFEFSSHIKLKKILLQLENLCT